VSHIKRGGGGGIMGIGRGGRGIVLDSCIPIHCRRTKKDLFLIVVKF